MTVTARTGREFHRGGVHRPQAHLTPRHALFEQRRGAGEDRGRHLDGLEDDASEATPVTIGMCQPACSTAAHAA